MHYYYECIIYLKPKQLCNLLKRMAYVAMVKCTKEYSFSAWYSEWSRIYISYFICELRGTAIEFNNLSLTDFASGQMKVQ